MEEIQSRRLSSPARPTVDWETASRCPICGTQMAVKNQRRPALNITSTVYELECRNINRCRWAEEKATKIVQILADGTIPVMLPGPKVYDAEHLTAEQQANLDEFFRTQYQITVDKREVRKE
jgi:hypothetical protein